MPSFKSQMKIRKRMERIHLDICRLYLAQKRAMERGAKRIDTWGDLDTQKKTNTRSQEEGELRPSFMDMANAFEAMLTLDPREEEEKDDDDA
jgi:hypothetical protein